MMMIRGGLGYAIFFGVTFLYLGLVMVLSWRLKAKHSEAWARIGRFSLVMNNSISGGLKFLRYFVFSSAYSECNDRVIDIMVVAVRITLAVWTVLFVWSMSQV